MGKKCANAVEKSIEIQKAWEIGTAGRVCSPSWLGPIPAYSSPNQGRGGFPTLRPGPNLDLD